METEIETPTTTCPACKGFGVLETKDGRGLVPCACQADAIATGRRRSARIPERYRNCSLQNFNGIDDTQRAALAMARRYVDVYPAVSAGLLIVGPVGRGKTHLATAILAELVEKKGVRGLFGDFSDLLDRIQATYSQKGEESADEILSEYRDAEVLVLDELGARRPTEWVREMLYGLLNTRYNRRLVTILTTNFGDQPEKPGGETLELRVGTAVRSRLAEMCQLVSLAGPDYRREVKPGRAFA